MHSSTASETVHYIITIHYVTSETHRCTLLDPRVKLIRCSFVPTPVDSAISAGFFAVNESCNRLPCRFPVILSIEDNCSLPAQRILASDIKEILGDLLLTQPVSPHIFLTILRLFYFCTMSWFLRLQKIQIFTFRYPEKKRNSPRPFRWSERSLSSTRNWPSNRRIWRYRRMMIVRYFTWFLHKNITDEFIKREFIFSRWHWFAGQRVQQARNTADEKSHHQCWLCKCISWLFLTWKLSSLNSN